MVIKFLQGIKNVITRTANIQKITDSKYLNLIHGIYPHLNDDSQWVEWIYASRKFGQPEKENAPDCVMIIPSWFGEIDGEKTSRLIIIKEYRYILQDWMYGFPSGLTYPNESAEETAKRELFEETGLEIEKIVNISKPTFTSAGMTDETSVLVKAMVKGKPTTKHLENAEHIEIIMATPDDIQDIMTDPNKKVCARAFAVMQGYMMFWC